MTLPSPLPCFRGTTDTEATLRRRSLERFRRLLGRRTRRRGSAPFSSCCLDQCWTACMGACFRFVSCWHTFVRGGCITSAYEQKCCHARLVIDCLPDHKRASDRLRASTAGLPSIARVIFLKSEKK